MKALLLHWRMWRYARQSPSLRPGTAERYRDELARLKRMRST